MPSHSSSVSLLFQRLCQSGPRLRLSVLALTYPLEHLIPPQQTLVVRSLRERCLLHTRALTSKCRVESQLPRLPSTPHTMPLHTEPEWATGIEAEWQQAWVSWSMLSKSLLCWSHSLPCLVPCSQHLWPVSEVMLEFRARSGHSASLSPFHRHQQECSLSWWASLGSRSLKGEVTLYQRECDHHTCCFPLTSPPPTWSQRV